MLIEKLIEYYDRQTDMPPLMYREQSIRYIIDLDAHGRYLGITDTQDRSSHRTKNGMPMLAPDIKRVGTVPKLLADSGEYVLGVCDSKNLAAKGESYKTQVQQKKLAFLALVKTAQLQTDLPLLLSAVHFLESVSLDSLNLPPDYSPKAIVTLRIDGVFVIDLREVRDFWAETVSAKSADGPILTCIGCGKLRSTLKRHPQSIKGIRVGHKKGTELISADKSVFESYGLENSLIAATCRTCATKYIDALNALLANDLETHVHVAGVEHVFWTSEDVRLNFARLISDPSPIVVKELYQSIQTGRAGAVRLDTTAFYALALGASGARAAVLGWIDTTVTEAQKQLARWFQRQDLVSEDGAVGEPLGAWLLALATARPARPGKKIEWPPTATSTALIRNALTGERLPMDLLAQSVRRNQAEQRVTRPRAMLIKMVLLSNKMESDPMAQLNHDQPNAGYQCGRLLAVLDSIQRNALGKTNATLVDRYYGTASSAPASVFSTILVGTRAHLSKLRKEKPGLHKILDDRLMAVADQIDEFPMTLPLPDQGMFALGYYHQRAEDRREVVARRASRDVQPQSLEEIAD